MTESISPAHGSGGKLMNDLIQKTIKEILGPDSIQIDDSAVLDLPAGKIAFTTDSFTITPLVFPGGDIGSLAINGTVNDLAVMGAKPAFLSCSLIVEEGLDMALFKRILQSMKKAADYAGVAIVTGDTKVVPNGKADKIFINTTGIGVFENDVTRRPIEVGDVILVNGSIGDHGIAIMAERNNLSFSQKLESDCAALNHLIGAIVTGYGDSIKFIRDATRGGVASVLNEIVQGTNFGAKLIEEKLPIQEEVASFCDILGIEPLYAANEGKVVIIVKKDDAENIIKLMREIPEGTGSAVIGEITAYLNGKAYMETFIGGTRILPLLIEEQLPRIC